MKDRSFWQTLSITGAAGILIYFAHVFIGSALWQGYDPIAQTISELTSAGAPNAEFLRILTTAYGLFAVFFSICVFIIFKNWRVHVTARIGALLLIIMEAASLFGYTLFPLDTAQSTMAFQDLMHIVVTGVVVLATLGTLFCTAVGLIKSPGHKALGVFVFVCAVVVTLAGVLTPVTFSSSPHITGLVERINIFTLQICLFVLSVYLFFRKPISTSE